MRRENETVQQAADNAKQAIDEAAEDGAFLISVWSVRDGQIINRTITMFDWQLMDTLFAASQLASEAHERSKAPKKVAPLKPAILKPNLFRPEVLSMPKPALASPSPANTTPEKPEGANGSN